MMLKGAEILFYPTAIGAEPSTGIETSHIWQRAMQGHAVSNHVPVIAANRIGTETNPASGTAQSYYGHSFIADSEGNLVQEMDNKSEGVIVHSFNLDELARWRAMWGFFRDRRTDLYTSLMPASK
jgi:N-carbamoylputrescine amidase